MDAQGTGLSLTWRGAGQTASLRCDFSDSSFTAAIREDASGALLWQLSQ